MIGVTKLDRMKELKEGEIPKKLQESRLKWYGHVLKREVELCGQESDGDG